MHGGTPSFLTPSGSTQDPDRYMQDLPPDLPTAALFEAIEKVDGRPWFRCRAIGCAMNHSAKQVAEDRMIAHSLRAARPAAKEKIVAALQSEGPDSTVVEEVRVRGAHHLSHHFTRHLSHHFTHHLSHHFTPI